MKKNILVLLALLLCMCTLMVSCMESGEIKFKDLVEADSYTSDLKTYTSATKLSVEGECIDHAGDLASFVKTGTTGLATYSVYNLATGAVVYTAEAAEMTVADGITVKSYEITLRETNKVSWFFVRENTVTTKSDELGTVIASAVVTLYRADGTVIADASAKNISDFDIDIPTIKPHFGTSVTNDIEEPRAMEDLIFFDSVFYRVSTDGKIEKLLEYNSLRACPYIIFSNENYYYGGYDDECLWVFDKELNPLSSYCPPDYAMGSDASFAILDNGNIFVQYIIACNDNSDDYTFYDEEGDKFLVSSLIVDAKTGDKKEVELDFVVEEIYFMDEEFPFGDKVKNFAEIYYIENERVDYSDFACVYASLDNNAQVDKVINGYVPGKISDMDMVANNRWIIGNTGGQVFLLNEKGDILGEISNADITGDMYLVNDGKVYNWDLGLVVDLEEKNAVEYRITNSLIMYETVDGEIKAFVDGAEKTIVAKGEKKTLDYIYDVGFVLVDEEKPSEILIYNDKAELIYTASDCVYDGDSYIAARNNDTAILAVRSEKTDGTPEIIYLILK